MSGNDSAGISFRQPKSFDERFGVAEQCSTRLDMKTPVLVDDMDNTTCDNYAAFPDRLYIVDMEGKIVYKGGRGPFGYKPRELEQSLLLVMMDAQIKARQAAAKKAEMEAEAKAKKLAEEKKAKEKEEARKKAEADAKRKLEEKKKAEMKKKAAGEATKKKKTRPQPPGPDPIPKRKPKKSRGPVRIG